MARQDTGVSKGLRYSGRRVDAGSSGWLRVADNLVLDEPGVLKPRPGFQARNTTTSVNDAAVLMLDRYNSRVFVAGLTDSMNSNTQPLVFMPSSTDTATNVAYQGTQTDYARFTASDGLAMQNQLFFLAGNRQQSWGGLMRTRDSGGSVVFRYAHVPRGLSCKLALNGASGWLANNQQVAYRVVFGYKYPTIGRIILGSPSSRTVLVNSAGGTRNVDVTIYYRPYTGGFGAMDSLDAEFFFQIYRTNESGGVAIPPGDTMYLVYERFFTASEITTSPYSFTITDKLQSGLGGLQLYTNSGQEGLAQANEPCPCASGRNAGAGDLETFGGSLWATNYRPYGNTTITFLAANAAGPGTTNDNEITYGTYTGDTTNASNLINNAGSASAPFLRVGMYIEGAGIPADTYLTDVQANSMLMSKNATATAVGVNLTSGDVITVTTSNSTPVIGKFWAAAAENFALGTGLAKFMVSSSATATTRIRETTESFINAVHGINPFATSAVGWVSAYHLSTDDTPPGHIYFQDLEERQAGTTFTCTSKPTAFSPASPVTFESKSDASLIFYSKPGQPEAWPPGNQLQTITGAVVYGFSSLREALLVWTNRGLFRVTGNEGDFTITMLDSSVEVSGVVSNTATTYARFPVVDNFAYGISTKGLVRSNEYQVERVATELDALLTHPNLDVHSISADPVLGYVFIPTGGKTVVYHTKNGMCSTWDRALISALYVPWNQKTWFIYNNPATREEVWAYRSQLQEIASYYDVSTAVTISSVTGTTTITLNASAPSGLANGDVIEQSGNIGVITNIAGAVLTVVSNAGFTAAAATTYQGFTSSAEWCPIGTPGHLAKHYRYVNALMDGSPADPDTANVMESDAYSKLFTFSWKTDKASATNTVQVVTPPTTSPYVVRNIVPADAARCEVVSPALSWRTSRSVARLLLLDLDYEKVGDKTRY